MPHVDEGTLHAYLDGELPSAERKTVETHLAECASCRATLADERALLERASALLGAARPADRPAPPFEQLRPPRAPKRLLWHFRMPVAWAASVALALGIGYSLRAPRAALVSTGADSVMDRRDVAAYSESDRLARADEERKTAHAPSAFGLKPAAAPPPARSYDSAPSVADKATSIAAAEGQRVDSAVATARASVSRDLRTGVAVIPAPAATTQLRSAAPAAAAQSKSNEPPALLEAIVVDGAAANGVVEIRGRATTTKWPIISRGTARTLLGTDPVGLPGLARQIRRSPANDGTVVVEQKIDSGTTIQIFQRQGGTAAYAFDTSVKAEQHQQLQEREIAPADRLARYVGRLRVEIAGPLTADSLNKLLDQVQPLP